jgi:hypothetical protein
MNMKTLMVFGLLGVVVGGSALAGGHEFDERYTSSGHLWETRDGEFYREARTGTALIVGPFGVLFDEAVEYCRGQGLALATVEQAAVIEGLEAREVIDELRRTSWLQGEGLREIPSRPILSGSGAVGYGWARARFAALCFGSGS